MKKEFEQPFPSIPGSGAERSKAEYISERVDKKLDEQIRLIDRQTEEFCRERGGAARFYEWYRGLRKENIARFLGPEIRGKI
ncbi:hypothetical protein MYX06_02830 [Patescibacteria group bacterium AH-259-L05]|nr:hypothetical protein [Patescibacteria group bacterium AH-259-L05]